MPKNKFLEPMSALVKPDFEFDIKGLENDNPDAESGESEEIDQIFDLDKSAKKQRNSVVLGLGLR